MGLFWGKKKIYAGVDIGSTNLKLVELSDDHRRPRLETYGYVEIGDFLETIDSPSALAELVALWKELRKKAHARATLAVTAIPSHSIFSSVLHLPKMKQKEIESAVKWEAKKIIPLSLDEMILDWRIVNQKKETQEKDGAIKVLLTSTPKELVQKYIKVFKALGISLLSLETESFALTRSLIGNDTSTIMLVDMGAKVTNITIVTDGIPVLIRTISQGGRELTDIIANKMQIVWQEAEAYKLDLRQELTGDLLAVMAPVIDEIKYSFTLFENQHKAKIEKVILTGGSSLLPGIAEHLSGILFIKVYVGNPWARLVYPEDLQGRLDSVGPQLAMSVGLAMREIF